MNLLEVPTTPFPDQCPGTSGLRKKTKQFVQPHYLENFVQAVFDTLAEFSGPDFSKQTIVLGGDGRYYNRQALQILVKMSVAQGFARVLVGREGVVSTPAMSAIIRAQSAIGGFILSASHNPGGPEEDFGIKYNIGNGGPAPAKITERVFEFSKQISRYKIVEHPDLDIDVLSATRIGDTEVEVIDPLADYVSLMKELFDFNKLRVLFEGGFRMKFDAMNAATGPYAHHILEELLGAEKGTVMRGIPLDDFGGIHPDPNQKYADELIKIMEQPDAPSFGAASDGDGDRNLILGNNFFVSPGDSLAIITEYAQTAIPAFSGGLSGVARSMPTSCAVDRVATKLGIECFETPTGWKFFGNLMDSGRCDICGEESFGTGSNHIREKDGLWAVLAWLSILAETGQSVAEITENHWKRFGRSYFQRHDFEALESAVANEMIDELRANLPKLEGTTLGQGLIVSADDFRYQDPTNDEICSNQGIRLTFESGDRVVCRLSGTGTSGATLRMYFDVFRQNDCCDDIEEVLRPLVSEFRDLLRLKERFGIELPTVVT